MKRPFPDIQHSCFLGFYSSGLEGGPCYIYQPEDKNDREASVSALAAEDLLRRPIEQAAHAEKKANGLQPGLKGLPRSDSRRAVVPKREGFDWYRYKQMHSCNHYYYLPYHRFQGHPLPYEHYFIDAGWSLLSYLSMAKNLYLRSRIS